MLQQTKLPVPSWESEVGSGCWEETGPARPPVLLCIPDPGLVTEHTQVNSRLGTLRFLRRVWEAVL